MKEILIRQLIIENIKVKKNKPQLMHTFSSVKLQTLLFLFLSTVVFAQENNSQVEMADVMRSNGKIYVVVGVVLIIFLGITTYLYLLNKKINRLEEKLKN